MFLPDFSYPCPDIEKPSNDKFQINARFLIVSHKK